jgi:hypothetical protein
VALRSDELHGRNRFIVFETLSNNQDSVLVAAGVWTAAVRPGPAVAEGPTPAD